MKAVILAAGKGTRMKHLTESVPKPMLSFRHKPILQHIVEGLANAGIRELCLILGWQGQTIQNHFRDGAPWNLRIHYEYQKTLDGTGKAPELAKAFLGSDPFLLTYGDILVDPTTYQTLHDRFDPQHLSGMLAVTTGQDVRLGAVCLFDASFRLRRLLEKPSDQQLQSLFATGELKPNQPFFYNAGLYAFSPVLFDFTQHLKLSPRGEFELTDAINAMAAAGHGLEGIKIAGRWVDVRDPETLAALESGHL